MPALRKKILSVSFFALAAVIFFAIPCAPANGQTYKDSDLPLIQPRSTWDNTPELHALMTWPPSASSTPSDWLPVERIVIHHSATPTNDPISGIARVQSIYRYHAVTQGWGDIGYNYIIDQQGNIYEGRVGGNGSRGGHAFRDSDSANFNYGSIGIVLLGDYSTQEASQIMYDSLYRLVGWLASGNGLDPQKIITTSVWNRNSQSFSTIFTGYTVLGHKNVDNTGCPGIIDLNKIRQNAAIFRTKYDNYIYQANSGQVYTIKNGTRKTFASFAEYAAAAGSSAGQIAVISQTQLDLFSETRFLKYPDGSLLQMDPEPAVYLIEGGKKRQLMITAQQFTALGFDFGAVKKATSGELAGYPDGAAIKYGVENDLLSDGVKVYLMKGGRKHWVTSGGLFNVLGLSWAKVKKISPAEIAGYLDGANLRYPDGSLLRDVAQSTIYLIKGGQKLEFLSAQSFLRSGAKWSNVILTDAGELALYPAGGFVRYADGTLIKTESPAVYLVSGGALKPIISAELFLNLGYKWSQILTVDDQEFSYYAKSDPIGYPEGKLIRPAGENNVYLISGGAPQLIDAATFKARRYSWTQVLVISQADFNALYRPASVPPAPSPSPSPSLSPTPTPTPSPTPSPAPSPSPNPAQNNPKIRIAIYEVTTPGVTLSANTAFNVLDKNGQIIAAKNANENYVYAYSAPASAYVKISPASPDGIVQIVSYDDHPAWKPTLNYNQFHGAVEIIYSAKSNKVWAVNELNLEDYLKGIAEINDGDPAEHQKTMIVAARTYAYYYIQKGGKRGADEVYILNNTSSDQLYKGYAREILAPTIAAAVNATVGQIVQFGGQPIITAYSSGAPELAVSGTRSACSVWGASATHFCQTGFEYLAGGVLDPAGAPYTQTVCGGGNHCVGLSAAGSRQFAKTGAKNYQEILKYYYIGTEIKKIY